MPSIDPDYYLYDYAPQPTLGWNNLGVLDADPTGNVKGDYYYNATTGKVRMYNGATWQDFSTYTNAAQTNISNTFTSGPQTIQTGNDVNAGLRIRQNSGTQSGNLTEWTNSAGTVISSVSSAGAFTGSGAGLTGIPATAITNTAVTVVSQDAADGMSATVIDTIPRWALTTTTSIASGQLRVAYFVPSKNLTVSTITMVCGTGGTDSGGTTTRQMGLFTVSGDNITLVAKTTNDTTLFNTSNTVYAKSLDVSYSLVAGTRYAAGAFCYNTGGTFGTATVAAQASQSKIMSLAPQLSGLVTGLTALPTVSTTPSETAAMPWVRLS